MIKYYVMIYANHNNGWYKDFKDNLFNDVDQATIFAKGLVKGIAWCEEELDGTASPFKYSIKTVKEDK